MDYSAATSFQDVLSAALQKPSELPLYSRHEACNLAAGMPPTEIPHMYFQFLNRITQWYFQKMLAKEILKWFHNC